MLEPESPDAGGKHDNDLLPFEPPSPEDDFYDNEMEPIMPQPTNFASARSQGNPTEFKIVYHPHNARLSTSQWMIFAVVPTPHSAQMKTNLGCPFAVVQTASSRR
ncbi:hypothetical protein CONPUDRAFT_159481 [Coniophora puteana RWD-64-598 SS2]|uniref:Uncharacterized protein n=1 Tax=Coniophora puteana (strain RWD-64-598) TaxID=741705 RepID=A0A5M3M7Z9_CONPW|nr:uncharacterized protein CONPUDRAFT_159481 [Coniophora puteana RWD-64-598 SS2]EIW75358.1 hypothetical protein CONPUDRAFT_159481 [Coniophora puteana RWD-64-598 SS2]